MSNEINEYEDKFIKMKNQRDNTLNNLNNLQDKYDDLQENYDNLNNVHNEFKVSYKEACHERNKCELLLEKKGKSKDHIEEFNKYKEFYNQNLDLVHNIHNIHNNDDKDNIISTQKEEIAELKASLKDYMKKWETKTAENILPKEENNNEKKKMKSDIERKTKRIKELIAENEKKDKKITQLQEELDDVNDCNKKLCKSIDEIETKKDEFMDKYHSKCEENNLKDKKIQDLEDELELIIEEENNNDNNNNNNDEYMNKYHSKCEEFTELFNKYNEIYDLYEKLKTKNLIEEKVMDCIQTQTENNNDDDRNFFIINDLKSENEKLNIRCTKSHENNEVLRQKIKDLEDRNDSDVNTAKNITNKEYSRENIDAVFDLVFKDKMKKTNDEKIYRRLTNKRSDISKKILNDLSKDNDKLDYGAEFVKCLINIM
jgi:hypothetical protein